MITNDSIVHFARNLLGCGCPEEVFRQVQTEAFDLGACRIRRIVIGERLLIYVVPMEEAAQVQRQLPLVLEAGRRERDRQGYNRLRTVVISSKSSDCFSEAQKIFDRWPDRDKNMFLHLFEPSEAGQFLPDQPR